MIQKTERLYGKIDEEIKDTQERFDRAAPARKEFWQGKLDEKNAKRDEIRTALGEITPAMQTEAYKQLETQLFTRLEGMSKQEIDALVDSGELPFSEEQVAVMRQRAQEAGIQKPSDIQKLPSQERLGYYAYCPPLLKTQLREKRLETKTRIFLNWYNQHVC